MKLGNNTKEKNMIDTIRCTGNFLSLYRVNEKPVYILHKSRALAPTDKSIVARAIQLKNRDTLGHLPLGTVLAKIRADWDAGLTYKDGCVEIGHRTTQVRGWDEAEGELFGPVSSSNRECLVLRLPNAAEA